MRFGIDFDNTIVCYDALFHKVALEGKWIPVEVPVNKSDVRNYLRQTGNEPVWTEMQGYVYGARMAEAAPYPGVLEFFRSCHLLGLSVCIISHKTRHPFLGERYDLHQSALTWLEQHSFFDPMGIGLSRENVFFELTKEEKLKRIGECACTHFIDDLPELLAESKFPDQTLRILFDPNDLYPDETRFRRITRWDDARYLLTPNSKLDLIDLPLLEKSAPFLRKHGVEGEFVLEPLHGGANNRVCRVQTSDCSWALKAYFHNPGDARDRFGTERVFYDLIWSGGIRRTPEPLAWDLENRLGLFSFINGRKLKDHDVVQSSIDQALEFVLEINRERGAVEATGIPVASEACFSIAEHVACIEKRVARFHEMDGSSEIDVQAQLFVKEKLEPLWREIRTSITEGAPTEEFSCHLDQEHRCLSPSDFGFHNALLAKDGRIYFIDFEYAGWDDPAKLICDFFCQPQLPAGLNFWDCFTDCLSSSLSCDPGLLDRARLLLPAYQIKWCCIMLNEFLRTDRKRRDFATGPELAVERKARQLQKASQALEKIFQTWKTQC